jgi:hypothetical protein
MICLVLLVCTLGVYAQQGINYKALIKDGAGALVANETIDVRFTIIADTGSTNVYVETHTGATTDANGIVILTIGDGTANSGVFADIAWGGDTHSLKVEIDIEQDASFVDMGTTQFMSVPYSLQATTATTATTATALTGGIDQAYIAALEARIAALEPPPAVGDLYKGGILFYIYEAGDIGYVPGEVHGLIAATTDQSLGIEWITGGNTQSTANGVTSPDIGTGEANTTAMMSQAGYTGGAAKVCADYTVDENGVTYDDWFLPSKDELNLMWSNLADPDGNDENTGLADPNNIGNLAQQRYWSSTEFSNNYAWGQYFVNGLQDYYDKDYPTDVRAVRAF